MGDKNLAQLEVKNTDNIKQQLGERELLVQIIKLQMMLNSKMFEFMRSYQQNQGGHPPAFKQNFSKTRVGRLFDEVNEVGFNLSKAVSEFIGEDLYERRDEGGRILAPCKVCKKESAFTHVYNAPYGMAQIYEAGTERLICSVCKKDTIYPGDERLPKFNSVFRLG